MTDLPYGRGGSPLQNLIVRGKKDTMLSAIQVEKELDAGAIYMKMPLSLEGSAAQILRRASNIIFEQGNIVELVYYKGLFIIVTANAISLANARSIRTNLARRYT